MRRIRCTETILEAERPLTRLEQKRIIDASHVREVGVQRVRLVNCGTGDWIMDGEIHVRDLRARYRVMFRANLPAFRVVSCALVSERAAT